MVPTNLQLNMHAQAGRVVCVNSARSIIHRPNLRPQAAFLHGNKLTRLPSVLTNGHNSALLPRCI